MAELPTHYGPYEILGPLGAGGMGQVYRARDTRLQRFVAIKVLRDDKPLDAERQQRFAQEALSASALNHPNILTVYDIGVEGDVHYLVSELIEGESLRAELNRNRLPLSGVIEIAHQVAEGLAAAHEAGIVHRDLKPENVMITADGRVKIIDFGLAKAPRAGDSILATHTATETADGLIMGTVPYMSPEQARGSQADFRSDQFSLGVMLCEMATGTHPFKRETPVQTLSAIITDEPSDLSQVAPPLPVAMRWLLRRLLAKNPRQRFAHTADLAADLRALRENLAEATSGSAVPVALPPARPRWPLLVALGVFVLTSVGILIRVIALPQPGVQFDRFTPVATDEGYQGAPAWSPDGKSIAYEAEINGVVQIFTRALGSAMRTKLTNSAFDCFSPTWSVDGYIYYHSQARDLDALWRVSPVGGNPEMLIEGATRSAISPDGKTVFFFRADNGSGFSQTLWSVSPPDGTPQPFTRAALRDLRPASSYLRFSPDGSKLLTWYGGVATGFSSIWEIPLPDGEPRQRLQTYESDRPTSFSWLPDNRHVVITRPDGPTPGVHLWLAAPDTGEVIPVTVTPGSEGSPSVSPDGKRIAFTSEATDFDLFEVPLDGSPLRSFLSSTRNEYDPATSPVSTQFAYVTDRTGTQQIWLQNREGYLQQPLVTESSFDDGSSLTVGSLAFSPDGTKLAFQRASGPGGGEGTGRRIWIAPVTGGGKPGLIASDSASFQDAPTWSPNGEWIAYLSRQEIGQVSLMKTQVGGRSAPVTLLGNIPAFVTRPQWSPDSEWILCETAEGLTVVGADGTRPRVISDTGWFAYAWDKDSRHMYGLRPTDTDQHHIMLVSIDVSTGIERVINSNLGPVPQALQPIRGFSRLPGGGFLTSIARVKSDIYLIEGFQLPRRWWASLWPFTE